MTKVLTAGELENRSSSYAGCIPSAHGQGVPGTGSTHGEKNKNPSRPIGGRVGMDLVEEGGFSSGLPS